MAVSGFEWFVAWRHLRDPERRSRKTLYAGLVLLGMGLGALLVAYVTPRFLHMPARAPGEWMEMNPRLWLEHLKTVGLAAAVLGLVVAYLGVLFASFTVFTAISIFGVFLGTAAPIIALSVMSGFEADLKSKIRATKADVVISRNDDRPFADWDSVQQKLAGIPGVVGSMAYLEAEVIIKHATNPAGMGIILRGIEPARAPGVLGLERTMKQGSISWLDHPEQIPTEDAEILRGFGPEVEKGAPEGTGEGTEPGRVPPVGLPPEHGERRAREAPPVRPGILLGEELYEHVLRVFIGSDVDVACPLCGVGPAGPMPKLKPFRVAGHFYSGMYEFDSKLAYVSLRDAQKFLNTPGEVTGIEIRTDTPERAHAVSEEIGRRLGPDYEVRSWQELNKGLFAALKLEKLAMFVVLTFIALVASFSVISTLLMLATQKGKEIAILKSMGARSSAVVRIFIAEGLYIGLLGLGCGLVAGITTCVLLARYGLPLDPDVYYIQKLPVVMRASEIAAVSLAALALCCLATLYPAMLASRLRPSDGLRYE